MEMTQEIVNERIKKTIKEIEDKVLEKKLIEFEIFSLKKQLENLKNFDDKQLKLC